MPELNRALWQRLSPLFDRALDLEMTARRDLLADVRLEDPGLAAALESLLAEHQRVLASDFLETPPLDGQRRRRWPVVPSAAIRWSARSAWAAWARCGWRDAATGVSRAVRRSSS